MSRLPRSTTVVIAVTWMTILAGCGKVDSRWTKDAPRLPVPATADGLDELRADVEKDPKSSDAHVRLAAAYFNQERLYEAANEYRRGVLLDRQNTEALLGLRQVLASLDDPHGTLALAVRAMRLNPDTPSAFLVIEEAARTFEKALAARPYDPYLMVNIAICEGKLKRWDKAERYYRLAGQVAPNTLLPRLMLGNLYLQQGLVNEAAAELEHLVQEQRNNAVVHQALAQVRLRQQRDADALQELVEAARLRPNWIVPHEDAGSLCLRLEKYDDAIVHFQKALKSSPHSTVARFGIAEALLVKADYVKAAAAYEKLLADYPKHPLVLNNLANVYAKAGKFDRALELAQRAVKAQPNSGIVRDTLGWISHLAGQDGEALTHMQEAARMAPGNGLIQYHLGKMLLVAGKRTEAVTALRSALSHGLPASEKSDAEKLLVGS